MTDTSIPVAGDAPTAAPQPSWPRAFGLAALVVYGPFLALALGGSLWLRCDHCRAGLWGVLPGGPGWIPVAVASNGWLLRELPESLVLVVPTLASLAMVAGVARLARRGRTWRRWTAGGALAVCTLLAYGMLRMMQA